MVQKPFTTSLGGGISYTELYDPKFKTCSLYFRFYVKRDPKTVAENALMIDLLTNCSAEYPTLAALTLQKQSLYGASLHSSRSSVGDVQELTISAHWINDSFALDHESVTDAMLHLTLGCLLHPNTQNAAFEAESFSYCKQNLLDTIDSEINQKRSYAMQRAAEIAYAGEPAACPPYGTRASAEAATAESAYIAWQKMLTSAPLEIVAILPEEKPQLLPVLREAFQKITRKPQLVDFESISPAKTTVENVEEPMPVTQCKLVMVMKTTDADHDAMRMLNLLLGGTTGSLLFVNVREKRSLCYYCASRYVRSKHALTIDCGVRTENLEETKTAIMEQIEAIRNGDFTDDMMHECTMYFEHILAATSDSQSGLAGWVLQQKREGSLHTMEETAAALRNITRAQVIAAANALQLDTIYTLLATKSDTEGEEA